MRRMVLVLSAGLVLAGCSQQAAPAAAPSPDAVTVNTVCAGVKQAYWHGSWWEGFSNAEQTLQGEGPVREIDGTMTMTGPGQAQLTASRLTVPQTCALQAPG
jgi:hypothetical protein